MVLLLYYGPMYNILTPQMDVEYTWILCKGKNCRQFRLLTLNKFIGQFESLFLSKFNFIREIFSLWRT